MATVLYLTANPSSLHPNPGEHSYGLATGRAFIDAYRQANPNDEIIELDLFQVYVPLIDADVMNGWGKLRSGTAFDQLSDAEKNKVSRLEELSNQFVNANKYVFVTPMWNFSFPPVVKAYIDSVAVAGKTFKYTEQGPVGLLTDRKMLHIQACGGVYSEGPSQSFEFGSSYLKAICTFFGIPEFTALFVEGMSAMPDKASEIKEQAIARAQELAKQF